MKHLAENFVYFCVVLAVVSLIGSALVVYAHAKIPQLRKHPGQMIVIICILQILFDLHWVGTIRIIAIDANKYGVCEKFAFFFNILVYINWNILTCFSLEVMIKIKRPLSTNYKSRMKTYTFLIVIITALEMTVTSLVGSFGLTQFDTCYIKSGTPGNWVVMVVVFVNTPIILTSILLSVRSRGYSKNKPLKKSILACIFMVITWSAPSIANWLSLLGYNIIIFNYISFLLGCSSGIALAVSRLWSYEIVKILANSILDHFRKTKKGSNLNDALIRETAINLSFKDITSDSFKDLILLLSLTMAADQPCKENYSVSYEKKKYYFEEKDCQKLSRFLDVSNLTLQKNGIWEYEKQIFAKIRNACEVSEKDLFTSICQDSNLKDIENINLSGRSGAFIFKTCDNKFIIKSVTRYERFFLLDILPAYCKKICKCSSSKIVRIIGLYKILKTKDSFIIMENIIESTNNKYIFDLKGSIDNRFANPRESLVLKDKNLLDLSLNPVLGPVAHKDLLESLKKDCKFLYKFNIIDYSLLISFHNTIEVKNRYYIQGKMDTAYSVGIIDFLQEFTFSKKLELFYKALKGKKDTSVCSPKKYYSRFLSFIEKTFIST